MTGIDRGVVDSRNRSFLIVGQGLAGSALALALRAKGCQVKVVDSGNVSSASRVAAGLITTLAGKGMNPAWRQEEYLPESIAFYQDLEREHYIDLLEMMPVIRPFSSVKEYDKFSRKSSEKQHWIKEGLPLPERVKADYGHFVMNHGGRLDVNAYLKLVAKILSKDLIQGDCNLDSLDFDGNSVRWQEENFEKVILCTGYDGLIDKYFSWLPSRSAKGEMLDITLNGLEQNQIISSGGWIVPIAKNTWRAGATYNWDELDNIQTEQGRDEVLSKISHLIEGEVKIEKQLVGIRPIVNKSKPVIGLHKDEPKVGIFNGLGSKGVISAIPVARHFAEYLLGETALDPELDVYRKLN